MTTPPLLDPQIIDQLMLARFELDDGRQELATRTDRGASKAIKSFHDALETFFIAVADHVGVQRAYRQFHEYPKVIEKATGLPFKHVAVVQGVNSLRTPVKHLALQPKQSAVQAISSRLNPVFEDNALQYLGHSFLGLSMAASIRHEQARDEVTAAEAAITKVEFGAALCFLRVAFDVAIGDYIGFREHRFISRRLEESVARLDSTFRQELHEANRAWDRMVRRLDLLENGINLADYTRFLAITPNVFIPGDPRQRQIYRRPDEPLIAAADNAAFALTFVIQALNEMESRVKPSNSRSFYRIRAKLRTSCFELAPDGSLVELQMLAPGEEVTDAHFALGPQGLAGHVWIWTKGTQQILAPFDAFEIVDEESEQDHYDKKRRARPKPKP